MSPKIANQTQPPPKQPFDVATKGYIDDIGGKSIETMSFANRVSHDSDTELVVSRLRFNPIDFDRSGMNTTVSFRALAGMGDLIITGGVKLRNVDDAIDVVTLAIGGTAIAKYESVLPQGFGAGRVAPGLRFYEVSIFLDVPSAVPTDTVELYSVEFRIVNVLP